MPFHLSVSDLNLRYGKRQVLFDVALDVGAGRIMALIGPVGSGKSTLLRAVNRMAELDGATSSGNVTLDGASVYMRDPGQLRTEVGMVLSEPVLFPGTVLDNITGGLRLHGMRDADQLRQKAEKALRALRMYDDFVLLLDRPAESLSLPQQQLICILRALALEPGLLLMDEPTRVMDSMSVIRLEEALSALKKKCTIVFATHILQQAGRLADDTALLIDGRVVEYGPAGDLFAHPRNKRTEEYITGRY